MLGFPGGAIPTVSARCALSVRSHRSRSLRPSRKVHLHFWLCPLVAALVRLARLHVPTTELLAATESFNSNLRVIVSITNNVGLFGVSVVFIILCAQNMTDLLQDLVPEMDQCLWTLVIFIERPSGALAMNEIGQISGGGRCSVPVDVAGFSQRILVNDSFHVFSFPVSSIFSLG